MIRVSDDLDKELRSCYEQLIRSAGQDANLNGPHGDLC